jgi:hypothetical protein
MRNPGNPCTPGAPFTQYQLLTVLAYRRLDQSDPHDTAGPMNPIPDAATQTASRMVENGGYGAALVLAIAFGVLGWVLYIRANAALQRVLAEVQALAIDSARASDRAVPVLSDVKGALLVIAERLR